MASTPATVILKNLIRGQTGDGDAGGNMYLNGGAGGTDNAGGAGGFVGGAGNGTGNGGASYLTGGAGGATSGVGGAATITGGAGGTSAGVGGAVTVAGGAATAAGTAGGAISLTGGLSTTSAAGGAITITGGGVGTTGVGGLITIAGGVGGTTSGAGGAVILRGGAGGTAGTGAGGTALLAGGASGTGATGAGGAVAVTGGAAASTNGAGGAAAITGGAGFGNGAGGAGGGASDAAAKRHAARAERLRALARGERVGAERKGILAKRRAMGAGVAVIPGVAGEFAGAECRLSLAKVKGLCRGVKCLIWRKIEVEIGGPILCQAHGKRGASDAVDHKGCVGHAHVSDHGGNGGKVGAGLAPDQVKTARARVEREHVSAGGAGVDQRHEGLRDRCICVAADRLILNRRVRVDRQPALVTGVSVAANRALLDRRAHKESAGAEPLKPPVELDAVPVLKPVVGRWRRIGLPPGSLLRERRLKGRSRFCPR